METQKAEPSVIVHPELSKYVISEADLMAVLDIGRSALDGLRDRGLPVIKLNARNRVYPVQEVWEYLKGRIKTGL